MFHNKHIFDQLDKDIHVTDPNYNYEILEHAIKESHSECFPERRVRFNAKKHKKTPWITNGILKYINNWNKLYKKLKQSRIDSVDYIAKKTDFNKYRNTLSKTITNAKRVYYNQIFDRYKYDMKITWNIISETLTLYDLGGWGFNPPLRFFVLPHLILVLHYCALGTFPKK